MVGPWPAAMPMKRGWKKTTSNICVIPGKTRVLVPHGQEASLEHEQHREFLAGCAFGQRCSEELSISNVQPGCAENILSFYFKCR